MKKIFYFCTLIMDTMHKTLALILLLAAGIDTMLAQNDTTWRDTTVEISGEWEIRRIEPAKKMDASAILNNLTIPLELGCAFTPKMGQTRPGFYMRTSLEYRQYKSCGWTVAVEFDSYTRKYEQENVNNINVTKGRDWTIDILAGGGWRVPFVKDVKTYMQRPEYNNRWSLCFMLYGGASCQTLQQITPAGVNTNGDALYHVETIDSWVPTAKFTMSLEYTLCYGISIYATAGYLQHIQKTRLESDYIGELITSLGLSFFFR